jgi:hypothetical protein
MAKSSELAVVTPVDADLLVFEDSMTKGIVVEPVRDLDEEEHCRISVILEPMGAAWEDVGYRGRWKIPRAS